MSRRSWACGLLLASLTASGVVQRAALADGGGDHAPRVSGTQCAADEWMLTSPLHKGREMHTATLPGDGRVLVVAGIETGGATLASAELYDPARRTWSAAGKLTQARYWHTETLLPSGRVLVTGGISTGISPLDTTGFRKLQNPT